MSKRTLIIIGVAIAVAVPLLVQSIRFAQEQSVLNRQAKVDARNQSQFLVVKQGRDTALVFDSGLLPLLAGDATCIANLAELHFAMTQVDAKQARSVAKLSNLKRLYFYDVAKAVSIDTPHDILNLVIKLGSFLLTVGVVLIAIIATVSFVDRNPPK